MKSDCVGKKSVRIQENHHPFASEGDFGTPRLPESHLKLTQLHRVFGGNCAPKGS